MANYILTCCSTVDRTKEYLLEHQIPYVCFYYTLEGKEYPDDLGETMPFDEFYARVDAGSVPTTSQVNVGQFLAFFEPMLQKGQDILHLTLSAGISGVYSSACTAAKELAEKYPDRKIYVVDSMGASSGYAMLLDAAMSMRDSGRSIDETRSYLEENRLNIHHWFFTTNLAHLKRGGRISATSATLGSLLGICPLMNASVDGKLIPRFKIRGKKNVILEMVKKMREHAVDGVNYTGKCYISHAACLDDALQIAKLVETEFLHMDGKVIINAMGPVIGSHAGPGAIALAFVGDKRID